MKSLIKILNASMFFTIVLKIAQQHPIIFKGKPIDKLDGLQQLDTFLKWIIPQEGWDIQILIMFLLLIAHAGLLLSMIKLEGFVTGNDQGFHYKAFFIGYLSSVIIAICFGFNPITALVLPCSLGIVLALFIAIVFVSAVNSIKEAMGIK